MAITADDVRNVDFPDSGFGRRGYAKHEVDALLDRAARTLSDEDDLTAAEVHHVQFGRPPIGKRGYDEKRVDDFLDTVEDALLNRTGVPREAHQVPSARDESPVVDEVPLGDPVPERARDA